MSRFTTTPLAALSVPQLIETHNRLAAQHGVQPLRSWRNGQCRLVEKVALMRTLRPQPSIKMQEQRRRLSRPTPIRNAILKELARVSHFEVLATGKPISKRAARRYPRKEIISVGFPYEIVLQRLRERCPQSTSSSVVLRWTATQVRNRAPGFEKCNLPQKRPHGMKKGVTYERPE